jgi:muconolactone delta-isomerase
MKYLVTIRSNHTALPVELVGRDSVQVKVEAAMNAASEFINKNVDNGVIDCLYYLLEQPSAALAIVNADDHASLLAMLAEYPLIKMSNVSVQPPG